MLIRWPRRIRLVAAVAGGAAIGTAVACTTVTGGTAVVDAKDAPAYRTSVSASVSASAVTSSARESERQDSLTTGAVHTACESMSTSSADAIDALNSFVDAMNSSADPTASEGAAAQALNQSADLVAADVNDTLPQPMRDAFNSWIDAARATATAVTGHLPPAQFNDTVTRLNDSRSNALNLCDAAY